MSDNNKLTNAVAAIRLAVEKTPAGDKVAILSFAETVEVVVPMFEVDADPLVRAERLKTVRQLLDRIRADGQTNIGAALQTAHDLIANRPSKVSAPITGAQPPEDFETLQPTASGDAAAEAGDASAQIKAQPDTSDNWLGQIVLLTDGQANYGPQTAADILAMIGVQTVHGESRRRPVLWSIGLGGDVDWSLLGALADEYNGSVYAIDAPHQVSTVVGSVFGALRSIACVDLVVRLADHSGRPIIVRSRGGASSTITTITDDSTSINSSSSSSSKSVLVLRWPQLIVGDRRHPIIELQHSASTILVCATWSRTTIKYTTSNERFESVLTKTAQTTNKDVYDAHEIRAQAAHALRKSNGSANDALRFRAIVAFARAKSAAVGTHPIVVRACSDLTSAAAAIDQNDVGAAARSSCYARALTGQAGSAADGSICQSQHQQEASELFADLLS
jgi:Mg-chelatase subunit ChlD